jgi:DNA polymerase-3 subunit delta'
MRAEAANAMLKILEEPWERTLFLLVSQSPEKLLPTVLSRTQEVAVPGVEIADMELWLGCEHGLAAEEAGRIARLSGGDVLEARRLLSGGDEDAWRENFDLFTSLMRLSYNDRHMELLEWADAAASMGREQQKRFLQYATRLLRESYMLNAGMDNVTYLWGEELDFCRKFSPFIGNHNIESLVGEIELTARQIGQNGNPRIIFPHFALTVSKLIVRL